MSVHKLMTINGNIFCIPISMKYEMGAFFGMPININNDRKYVYINIDATDTDISVRVDQ